MKFHSLKIFEIKKTTKDASIITFEVPSHLRNEYQFEAGQYVTVQAKIGEEDIRRSYSICSVPDSKTLQIGVKQIDNGLFSTYANQQLRKGDALQVSLPEGRYVYNNSKFQKNVMIFASGSGITPNISIVKTFLQTNTTQKIYLIYGNKTPDSTMFFKELNLLRDTYKEQLEVVYIFSQYQHKDYLFGRIDTSTVTSVLEKYDADIFYVCGPKEMNVSVSDALSQAGVLSENIYFELFNTTITNAPKNIRTGVSRVSVTLDSNEFSIEISQKKSVLESLLKEGIDAPYSCQGGVCASCIARLKKGQVKMVNNQVLTDGEIEEGMILTCQSFPTTDDIEIDYNDV